MRIHRTLIIGTALAVMAAGSVPATAQPPRSSQAQPSRPPTAAAEKAVTLITGDRVFVSRQAGRYRVRVEPVRRVSTASGGGFLQQIGEDRVTVIPAAAVPLVRAGVLDRSLFDVTGLIRQGFDDARSAVLPLLVEPAAGRAAPGPAVSALGRVTRELPAARLTAVTATKDRTGRTFGALTSRRTGRLAAGLGRVWLNGRAVPSLDASVRQVGAPTAWAAGHTGRGVTVAVLDSGYDPEHPDLAGIVTGQRDFIGDPEGIRDTAGHGTHVAATVAGRGAASGGRYTGVAKEANLLIGKVCAGRECSYDAIIAGMHWAAESGARVVNMSLGGEGTDGTDVLSQELNQVSAQYGTLFVVAAGNSGAYGGRVSNPASADAALAVASVSRQDTVSDFSSRGPRIGDFAVKPDIAAPGEDIVAARAKGTLDEQAVDEHHARLSGTSMATPHVAGAAAILAAQHPEWRAAQLKAVLMNSAQPVADGNVFGQGAGRLDVARADGQRVTTSPASVSFGRFAWPHSVAQPVGRRITYRNTGTTAVTLSVRVEATDAQGRPAPAGMFGTDVGTLTVPAGGDATLTLTVDPKAGPVGSYSGRLIASGTDGTVVQTPIGADKEPESYDLTVRMTDRDGATPAPDNVRMVAISLDDPARGFTFVNPAEPVRLRAGRYAVLGYVDTVIPGQGEPAVTSLAEPELTVGRNTTIVFDARKGRRVDIRTDQKDARLDTSGRTGVWVRDGRIDAGYSGHLGNDLYAVPTRGSHPHFIYYLKPGIQKPLIRLATTGSGAFEVPVEWAPESPTVIGSRALDAVDVGHAAPEEIAARDVRGRLAIFTLGEADKTEYDARVGALADAGAAAVLLYLAEPIGVDTAEVPRIPVMYTLRPEGPRLSRLATAGPTRTGLIGIASSPYRYELAFPSLGRIPGRLTFRPRNSELAAIRTRYHTVAEGSFGYREDRPSIGGFDMSSGSFSQLITVPSERIEYRSPGPIVWDASTSVVVGGEHEQPYYASLRKYRAGQRLSEDWGKAVYGPSFDVALEAYTEKPHLAFRDGDTVDTWLPLFSDAERHHGTARYEDYSFADKGHVSLYADGQPVGRSETAGEGVFTVPAGAAAYRLVADVTRDHPSWPLATRVSAEWTFRSGHTDGPTALPLLSIGFDPRLDLANYAPGGRRFSIPVRVDRQPGSTGGRTMLKTVEVSYDEGGSWHPAPLRRSGHGWAAEVTHPESGFVSLRATAADTAGNTVTQTTLKAYRLKTG